MKSFPLRWGWGILLLSGCMGKAILDPSPQAVEANDLTLMISACEAVPGRGMDICRVKEGTEIASSWKLVLPVGKNSFLNGELTVYFKDISKTYPIQAPVVEIPWSDLLGDTTWKPEHDGMALAMATIRWKTPEGIEELWKARGFAKVVVTKPGYDVLSMDSGFVTWGTKCEIAYSTAGRSAIRCR